MMESFLYMRLRKPPYTEFRRVSTSLDDFPSIGSSSVFMINNIPMMDLELKAHDLISFMNPMFPNCHSKNVVKNGTCLRTMENGLKISADIDKEIYEIGKVVTDEELEKVNLIRDEFHGD